MPQRVTRNSKKQVTAAILKVFIVPHLIYKCLILQLQGKLCSIVIMLIF